MHFQCNSHYSQQPYCPVSAWLHGMIKSGFSEDMVFVLNFVPAIVWAYLYRESLGTRASGIIALLLTLYGEEKKNYELSKSAKKGENRNVKSLSFVDDVELPDLTLGSIFHKAHDKQ